MLQFIEMLVTYVSFAYRDGLVLCSKLHSDLRYIENSIKKVKGRSGVRKLLSRRLDQIVVQGCRERLIHPLTLFGVSGPYNRALDLFKVSRSSSAILRFASNSRACTTFWLH